jgi:putative transcriptional regulator
MRKARTTLNRLPSKQPAAVNLRADDIDQFIRESGKLGVMAGQLANPKVDPKTIRDKQGLSQTEFACLYGLEVATLKNWEQGINAPDLPARILLEVIDRCPHAVIEARTSGHGETFANALYVCKVHHDWSKYGKASPNPWDWQHTQPHWRVTYHPPVWQTRSKVE